MKAHYLLSFALLASTPVFAGGYTHADVCKAVLAVELGHEIGRLRIVHSGDTPEIVYIHKETRLRSRYRCQFPGNERVTWASYLDDKKNWGRWHDQHDDGAISYVEKGTHLTVKNTKGREREFTTRDFRQ
ncbi:hypothetical protein [Pseudomonas typographi]|uniref:Lipoprotein n=1 Tax=Pseudomonas typographi TaxID=2715964 RepID=A0ABR7YWF0_9PSED|nr:hypothetical protein [Pseudomonas typographi]MBD1552502.1 hypothetical protein [Pseudomonas typographi]MBD1585592.1 hypothetical protein [Pseudomonas typographi]MBD1597494.1 hypothetical protein [Pseudomonas typographi]